MATNSTGFAGVVLASGAAIVVEPPLRLAESAATMHVGAHGPKDLWYLESMCQSVTTYFPSQFAIHEAHSNQPDLIDGTAAKDADAELGATDGFGQMVGKKLLVMLRELNDPW